MPHFLQVFRLLAVLFGLVFIFPVNSEAQGQVQGLDPGKSITQYVHDVWQKDRGLPQNTVLALSQTPDGFLWIGTLHGLARFNGVSFEVFEKKNYPDLASNSISQLLSDQDGSLWIGSLGGGLSHYSEGKFQTFTTADGLNDEKITALYGTKDGQVWVGTPFGLNKVSADGVQAVSLEGLNGHINAMTEDAQGRLLIGTRSGLFRIEKNGEIKTLKDLPLPSESVTALLSDSKGNLWIGTERGLLYWNTASDSTTLVTYKKEESKIADRHADLGHNQINVLFEDAHGAIWVGTEGDGLKRFWQNELDGVSSDRSLSGVSVRSLFQDKEGSLWIGLNRSGLNRLRDDKFEVITTEQGLTENIINCLTKLRNGEVWVGAQYGGVSRYMARDSVEVLYLDGEQEAQLNHVQTIHQSIDSSIWVGTNGVGVIRFHEAGVDFFRKEDGRDGESLTSNYIRTILSTDRNKIWIGTRKGLTLYNNGKFITYLRSEGLSGDDVTTLCETPDRKLWVGTDGGGITVIDLADDMVSHTFNTQDELPSDAVFCFHVMDSVNNSLLVGTRRGLSYIRDGIVFRFSHYEERLMDEIHEIIEDDAGFLWFTSHNGIFKVSKKKLMQYIEEGKDESEAPAISVFDETDGLRNGDCPSTTSPKAFKDEDGILWFATGYGVAKIDPLNHRVNTVAPNVLIRALHLDEDTLNLMRDKSELLIIPAGNDKFEFHFEALSFIAPEKIRFEYRLEGVDKTWKPLYNERKVFYANLKPGTYTFHLRAANSDGTLNEKGTSLTFRLEPLLTERTGFWLVLIFLLVLAVVGIIRYRSRQIRLQKKELEETVAERTHELTQRKEAIEQQNEEIQTIDRIVRALNKQMDFGNVLKILLKQGLQLFNEADRSFYLSFNAADDSFKVSALASSKAGGFAATMGKSYSFYEVINYCKHNKYIEHLNNKLYKIRRGERDHFIPGCEPVFSLVMPIMSDDDSLEGIIFFDYDREHHFTEKETEKIRRFRSHAFSALAKARFLKEISKQNIRLEKTIGQVSDSIRYAQRIQSAIMKSPEDIIQDFKDCFIFYRPRDVVSGDFYWYNTYGKYQIMMAIDCTGHGVPGAFMTVMGNSLINQIVNERGITEPAEILNTLDELLAATFKSKGKGTRSTDGMDIAMICFDKEEKKLHFAGARNPLYYVRNNEIHQVKGSKYPIGNAVFYKQKEFESHTLDVQKDDIFYLFSDGFQDQFGGESGGKFLKRRFRHFLLEYSYQTMEEQAEMLSDALRIWKGERRQTDDILVIGMKFF